MGIKEKKLELTNRLQSLEQRRRIVDAGLRDIRTRLGGARRMDPSTSSPLITKQQQLAKELAKLDNAIADVQKKLAAMEVQDTGEYTQPQPDQFGQPLTPAKVALARPASPPIINPPAAETPGGPAVLPRQEAGLPPNPEGENPEEGAPSDDGEEETPPAKETPAPPAEEGAAKATADAVRKKLWDRAKDSIKKKFNKQVWGALLKNPYFWMIVGIIVLIIIIAIVIFAVFYDLRKKTGQSDSQTPSYMADQDALAAALRESGDPDVASEIASDVAGTMKENLTLLKDSITDTALLQKIDDLILKITQNQGTMDTNAATQIVNDFEIIMQEAANFQAPKLAVAGVSPVVSIIGYNEEIHFGTPLHKEMPSGSEVGHATYMQYGKGTADAVDLYVATDTPVVAPIPGKIEDLSDDGTGHKKIVISQGDYELLIAFIKPEATLAVGQDVIKGQAIGTAAEIEGTSQIHLELAYCGKNITLVTADQIIAGNKGKAIGEYLWDIFKFILKIQ